MESMDTINVKLDENSCVPICGKCGNAYINGDKHECKPIETLNGAVSYIECNGTNSLEIELTDGSIQEVYGIKESFDEIKSKVDSGEEFIVVGANKMVKIKSRIKEEPWKDPAGHHMLDGMNGLSEETAQKLSEAFNRGLKASKEFTDTVIPKIEQTLNSMIAAEGAVRAINVVTYTVKVSNAYFFTRWYYKRKLNKAESKLKSFNQIRL